METEFGPKWRSGGAAGEDAVPAFESKHRISLPNGYRAFVADAANGAVGPLHYGLVPAGEPAGANGYHIVRPGSLAQPFPLTEFWLWDGTDDLKNPAN
jgi:hypothetical protein